MPSSACSPAAAATTSAATPGIPRRRRRGLRRASRTASRAPIDLGEANGAPFLGIASLGFDSEANAAANAAPRLLGRGIYVYGALSAVARWKPATFEVEIDGQRRPLRGLERHLRQHERLRWRHVRRAAGPHRRRPARPRPDPQDEPRALPRLVPQGLQGRARPRAPRERPRARARSACPRAARSPSSPTATRSPICRSSCASLPAAVRVLLPPLVSPLRTSLAAGVARGGRRVASRRSGRGGTSLPGKVLLALDPRAIDRLGGAAPARAAR